MSIISQETDERYPLPEEGPETIVTMSRTQATMLQRKAYAAGASRPHDPEEIEAAANAINRYITLATHERNCIAQIVLNEARDKALTDEPSK